MTATVLDFDRVRLALDGNVATLVLNHPEVLNAVSTPMLAGLMAACDAIEDPAHDVRCVLLTGEGRAFCAGANLQGRGGAQGAAVPRNRRAGATLETEYHPVLRRLRDLRDRAFLITLADTGLRVHEACGLRRGDLDWNEGRAIIIGKGNKQAVVRFSQRSLQALRDYLSARARLDGGSGRPLAALPLFARHDKGAGKKIKPITTATGRNIVAARVEQILGFEAAGTITPHSFRHYFVTRVLQASGNLKLAQELARHTNIAVTQRYAHLSDDELDKGYYEAFEDKP